MTSRTKMRTPLHDARQARLGQRRCRFCEESDRLADDVRRANELKGHLLRTMSHDLLNLLNAAKGFGYLAAATRNVEKAHQYVRHMLDALAPIERMAEDLRVCQEDAGDLPPR